MVMNLGNEQVVGATPNIKLEVCQVIYDLECGTQARYGRLGLQDAISNRTRLQNSRRDER
jgi:hypothetical protein